MAQRGQYLDSVIVMDMLAETGGGSAQGTWVGSCPLELDGVHGYALALGTGQRLRPWDVPEGGLPDRLLL